MCTRPILRLRSSGRTPRNLARTLAKYPDLEHLLPAMGYGREQMDELEHYIAATGDETIEAQLLKYTRVSQPTTDAVPIYSKR